VLSGAVLALDTGSPIVSVAVGRAGSALAERSAAQALASTRLVPMISEVLAVAALEPRQLDGVVALAGPGSFTGLRIGLATALGMHQTLGIGAVAVPTLELLAGLVRGPRVFGAVRGPRGMWFLAERGRHEPFGLHETDLAALAPATLVGFGAGAAPGEGIEAVEPPPLAAEVLRFVAERRTASAPATLLSPHYLGSNVVAIAEESDPERIAAIETAAFATPWSERQLRDAVADARALVLAAVLDGRAIAYALFGPPAGEEAELLRVAVAPGHRRRGLGRRLVAAGLARLRARGVLDVHLEVEQGNAAARALYESLGFAVGGARRGYYADGGDALLMRRTTR
jgi:ribosomal-protein-alanine N-acetyltransferase